MRKSAYRFVFGLIVFSLWGYQTLYGAQKGSQDSSLSSIQFQGGLIGLWYEGNDFERSSGRHLLKDMDGWMGPGPQDWAGRWWGYIQPLHTGEVTFRAEANGGVKLEIGEEVVIDGMGRDGERSGTVSVIEGKKYPIVISYVQDKPPAYLKLYWSWDGKKESLVDRTALSHTQENEEYVKKHLGYQYVDDRKVLERARFWDKEQAPIHFTGEGRELLDFPYQHGGLPPVVGVHNYQVFRANREHPELAQELGYTYNHQPMLAYWKGKFYLEFNRNPKDEHVEPSVSFLTISRDGKHWSTPKVVFPSFIPEGQTRETDSHHRMGFYVSSSNRLLVLSFYQVADLDNAEGVGRAVREIYSNGSLGPVYFIRYNRHPGSPGKKWGPENTPYPLYKDSDDEGFVKACKELLANKLFVQQWWEADKSTDGFYAVAGYGSFTCKAFDWYTRDDGKVVGLWKNGYASISSDRGRIWKQPRKLASIIVGTAKMWGQRMEDGRYGLIYNPHCEFRFPLVMVTSSDGRLFRDMAYVHGEVPDLRYEGSAKDMGPQYVRGISEGNGDAPGSELWITYSVHKEDIWASRVPVPVRTRVKEWVDDTFDEMIPDGVVENWNIYSPSWAPVEAAEFPTVVDKSLRLEDREPYDYARAIRVFPESKKVLVEFDLLAGQSGNGRMEVEVADKSGRRPVRVMLTEKRRIQAANGEKVVDLQGYKPDRWLSFRVKINVSESSYSLSVNGRGILKAARFAEEVDSVHRLSFRTGKYRMVGKVLKADGAALPRAGDPVTKAVYYLNNVKVRSFE